MREMLCSNLTIVLSTCVECSGIEASNESDEEPNGSLSYRIEKDSSRIQCAPLRQRTAHVTRRGGATVSNSESVTWVCVACVGTLLQIV